MIRLSTNYSIWVLFYCVLDWIEGVIFDMATNIETSFSSLVHEIVLKALELTESSCFWIVTSFCVPFKHYYNPFLVSGMFTYDGQAALYLLLLFVLSANFNESTIEIYELEIWIIRFKKSILLWNRPWQNSLGSNWMMPCLTWLAAFLGRMGPILPEPLPFHCTE
jgi:hypothetical protein